MWHSWNFTRVLELHIVSNNKVKKLFHHIHQLWHKGNHISPDLATGSASPANLGSATITWSLLVFCMGFSQIYGCPEYLCCEQVEFKTSVQLSFGCAHWSVFTKKQLLFGARLAQHQCNCPCMNVEWAWEHVGTRGRTTLQWMQGIHRHMLLNKYIERLVQWRQW